MNEAFQQFKSSKLSFKNKMKEDRASSTLEWYKKLQEMLESVSYSKDYDFLKSVLEFIEEKEYLTDRQIDICQKIYDHPDEIDSFGSSMPHF